MSAPNTTELRIDGMTCNNCARHVTETIQSVAEVHSATVSLSNKTATVRWNSGADKKTTAVIRAIAAAGYEANEISADAHEHHHSTDWQWTLFLGLAVMVFLMAGEWIFHFGHAKWFQWLAFALAAVVQVVCGAQFYRGAWNQLKVGSSNMDTLVALGSTTAFGFSCWILFSGAHGHLYFMEAAAIISLVSLGHWLEARVSEKASGALNSLLSLAPEMARQKNPDGSEKEIAVSKLQSGDEIILRPGDKIPVDGIIVAGESAIDESMLTGESVPADKKIGSELFAGTTNLNSRLILRVTKTGEQTALANIIAAVQRAQTSRADIQRLGDRISNVFVPIIIMIALAAGIFWAIHSGAEKAFIIAAGVLIVACPCAMGLATPVAIMASANAAARRGILIRDGTALEKAGQISAIVFDKTGTLTSGELAVMGPWTPDNFFEPSVKQAQKIAGALAKSSNHPISKVLAWFSSELVELKNWQEISGSGVQAELNSEIVRLGSLSWLHKYSVNIPENEKWIEQRKDEGATFVGLAKENSLMGIFALRDFLKDHAARVIWQLQRQGLKTYLLTGDNPRTARGIAKQINIAPENVFAEVRPEQKAEFIKKLQAQGECVAFVGDGINDAPALTQADLGIAVSRASDVAREAADIILLKSEIEAVPEALGLARATLRTIKQNLFWAFFYNALGVPLAACGIISPIFCAVAMGFSDFIVIGNALRLLRWKMKKAE